MNSVKVSGVVVLYNPQDSVMANINTYIGDLDVLYVIDNSINKNQVLIEKIKNNLKCIYIDLHGNLGLSVALNIGCDSAIKEGCDYILTMDQDSYFEKDALRGMKEMALTKYKDYSLIAPNVCLLYPNNKKLSLIIDGKDKICNWVMTSGSLMKTSDFKSTTKFDENLFIEHIDIDLGMQYKINDLKIIRLSEYMIYQRQGNSKEKNFLWKKVHPLFENEIRTYYLFRNHFYLLKKYKWKYQRFSNVNLVKSLIKILVYEDKRRTKIQMAVRGIVDALRGKTGQFTL